MKFSHLIILLCCLTTGLKIHAAGRDTVASSPEDVSPLLPGMEVPEVELVTIDGERFALKSEAGSQPTIIIFYRGGW